MNHAQHASNTNQHCCRQQLQATMLPAVRAIIYLQANVEGNAQLCNYLSYMRQLCSRQQLPATKSLCVWPTLNSL